MFFSQFYKSQNIEYRECRWNVENYCTKYNENYMNKFINDLTSKFYFKQDINLDKIDLNNLEKTLDNCKMLEIKRA